MADELLVKARAEAVQEISSSMLKAAGAAMMRHGNDPEGGAIVAAGFVMALRAIGEHLDPRITETVRQMLSE